MPVRQTTPMKTGNKKRNMLRRLLACAVTAALLFGATPVSFAEEEILLCDQIVEEDPDDIGIVLVEDEELEPAPEETLPEEIPAEPAGETPEEPAEDTAEESPERTEEEPAAPEETMNPGSGMTSYLQLQRELVFAEKSDPTADVEDAVDWWRMFADMELSGNWAEDLLLVAESQLGYTESELNFNDEDPWHPKGYTRYGAWYGVPYGDWCAMFICFCMYYAEIPDAAVPYNCYCSEWVRELTARGMYRSWDSGYTPKRGDLVFFDFDEDEKAEHVGIVRDYDAEKGWLYTIEGNRYDYVEHFVLTKYDYAIVGYCELPENPNYDPAVPVVRQNGRVELPPDPVEPTPPRWESVREAASGIKNVSIVPTVEASRVNY